MHMLISGYLSEPFRISFVSIRHAVILKLVHPCEPPLKAQSRFSALLQDTSKA